MSDLMTQQQRGLDEPYNSSRSLLSCCPTGSPCLPHSDELVCSWPAQATLRALTMNAVEDQTRASDFFAAALSAGPESAIGRLLSTVTEVRLVVSQSKHVQHFPAGAVELSTCSHFQQVLSSLADAVVHFRGGLPGRESNKSDTLGCDRLCLPVVGMQTLLWVCAHAQQLGGQ